jgi:hypothetical protein
MLDEVTLAERVGAVRVAKDKFAGGEVLVEGANIGAVGAGNTDAASDCGLRRPVGIRPLLRLLAVG